MKKKIRFITNPVSGVKHNIDYKARIDKLLDHSIYDLDYCETQYAGHAVTLAKEAVDASYDSVVAIGGDGSINEVASQLLHSSTILGIIPAGSGNGFANGMGIKRHDLRHAISLVNNRKTQLIDSCKLNDQFFINVAGIGFDGRISYLVKHGRKRGLSMYLKHTLKESLSFKPKKLSLLIDDKKIDGSFVTVTIANGSYYGYNFAVAPLADVKDGLMDVVMIKKTYKIMYFLSAYRFLNRTLHKSRFVDLIKAKKVEITSPDDDIYYHIDGEGSVSTSKLSIEIDPLSIKVFC